MAASEHDREDILREATALVERVELITPNQSDSVIVGFRRDGSASFFFGPELVVQFNTANELRRGYDRGHLLKARLGKLVVMQRVRNEHEVTLLSRDLTPVETAVFSQKVLQELWYVREALKTGTVRIGRQVPDGTDVAGRVLQWLNGLKEPLRIADQPNAAGRSSGKG